MKTKIALLALALLGYGYAFAQAKEEKPVLNDNPDKNLSHFASVQANQLIQQIFSFGPTPQFSNPFLLKYALRFNNSNNEITAGLGLNTSTNKGSDGVKSEFTNLDFRLGWSKKYPIARRFEAGVGVDVIAQLRNSTSEFTQTTINPFGGEQIIYTSTSSEFNGYGGGPQFNFAYYLNKKVKIGTEASYYFIYREEHASSKSELTTTDVFGNQVTNSSETSDSNFGNSFAFNLPVALFLTIRF